MKKVLGTLTSNDGDGNENVKKAIGLGYVHTASDS